MTFLVHGSRAEPIEHPYFWKVEKDGKVSHILGTVHVAVPIDELLCPKEIQDQLEKSDLVFLEADPHSEDFIEAEREQAQWATSTDGREFRALSPENQEFLRSRGISENLNLYGYDTKVSQLCNKVEDGKGVDSQVSRIADSQGIPIQGLEDYYPARRPMVEANRQRAELYSQLPEGPFTEEIRRLNYFISRFSRMCPPVDVVHMIESYKSGSIVEVILDSMMRTPPEVLRRLQERNSRWMDRFEKTYQSHKRIFVAAGLVHFLGPVSFTGMLEEKGYKVELVNCEQ